MKINSLYIHYPFCYAKCNYCNFYSIPYDNKLFEKYIISLNNEYNAYKSKYNLNNIETIYIGGGTPSINQDCIKLINEIISSITLNDIIEYTVECNPRDVNQNLINILNTIKCNRVSLGIQSFSNKILKLCNRKQTNDNVFNALNLFNENGFNISIDLINGFPKTDINYELNNLEYILNKFKNINHISLYDLTIEKGSVFYKNNIDLDEKIIELYENKFINLASKFDFKKYEVSNYCKNNKYSHHNYNYWKYNNYLGLGPSAHSTIDNIRIENKSDLDLYITGINYKIEYELSVKEQIEEYILMGFRLIEGINFNNFKKRFNLEFLKIFQKSIDNNNKYFITDTDSISINDAGLKILNILLVDFFIELEDIKI